MKGSAAQQPPGHLRKPPPFRGLVPDEGGGGRRREEPTNLRPGILQRREDLAERCVLVRAAAFGLPGTDALSPERQAVLSAPPPGRPSAS
jgi:hypothetical protein